MNVNGFALFVLAAAWAGVAMQSLAMLVVLAWLALYFRKVADWRAAALSPFKRLLVRWSCILGLSWLLWAVLASQMNPATVGRPPGFFGGYLWWALCPWTASIFMDAWSGQGDAQKAAWSGLFQKLLLWGAVIVCLIALSQWFFGWKIHGTKILESERRARVLFSHPLSLAYVVLLYAPLAVFALLDENRRKAGVVGGLACGVLLVTSSSRTVQAVMVVFLGLWSLCVLRGRARIVVIALGLLMIGSVALIDNPLRTRFVNTATGSEDRQQNKYADDRLAFWAAHWEMFKERPVAGHGNSYTQEYLSPYYSKVGLAEFEKKYQAHNMFLQIMVNTGIVGLLIWLVRVSLLIVAALRMRQSGYIGWVAIMTITAMLIAGVTQNAFQDSAVRFHWAILEGALIWFAAREHSVASRDRDRKLTAVD